MYGRTRPTRVCVTFELQGEMFDGSKAGRTFDGMVALPCTLGALREAFPFYGEFHFRQRVIDDEGSFLWLDLADETRELALTVEDENQGLEIRALPISFDDPRVPPLPSTADGSAVGADPDLLDWGDDPLGADGGPSSDDESDDGLPYSRSGHAGGDGRGGVGGNAGAEDGGGWRSKVANARRSVTTVAAVAGMAAADVASNLTSQETRERLGEHGQKMNEHVERAKSKLKEASEAALSSETAVKLTKGGVKGLKAMGSFMSAVGGAVKTMAVGEDKPEPVLPSPAASLQLVRLGTDLTTKFDDANSAHTGMLRELWAVTFGPSGFARPSSRWKELGFVNEDPVKDAKGSGILGLRGFVYFATNYPDECKRMTKQQRGSTDRTYPLGIVAMNIALLLVDILSIKRQRFQSTTAVHWQIMEDPEAFFELYCVAFRTLDQTWREQGAARADFGKIMGATKSAIEVLLAEARGHVSEVVDDAIGRGFFEVSY